MAHQKLGIIGGGQLGMLLTQAAIQFPATVSIFDPDPKCSAAPYTHHFVTGNFSDYDAILNFGKKHDAIIFETEKTNVSALRELQQQGIRVVSSPHSLQWIQDKGIQKQTLAALGIPIVPAVHLTANQVKNYAGSFPVVQKWCTGGYDGYGVQIHEDKTSLSSAAEVDSIFEEKILLHKELSMLVVRDIFGNTACYDPTEMVFDEQANLVDYLIAPAQIDEKYHTLMQEMCIKMAENMNFLGIYAVEFFLDTKDRLWVNEISPRPHNSGHHTISCHVTSQYEQQVRIALGLPLGSTEQIHAGVLVNLLADTSAGPVKYEGLEKAFTIPNVQYTFYGKEQVRPRRKMGHALILEKTLEKSLERMNDIRKTLTITSYE